MLWHAAPRRRAGGVDGVDAAVRALGEIGEVRHEIVDRGFDVTVILGKELFRGVEFVEVDDARGESQGLVLELVLVLVLGKRQFPSLQRYGISRRLPCPVIERELIVGERVREVTIPISSDTDTACPP